ncbi:MAG TPA: VWA domain-containing protein [Opitutaceae bacterium]|nr:VWA domain-containing protein [Opitutaceae bacterium]
MGHFVFHDPLWLLLLLALPLAWWLRQRQRVSVLVVPFAAAWHRPSFSSVSRWPVGLVGTGLVLLIVALARPQRVEDKRESHMRGYDLMLAVDLSGSMLAEDYERGGDRINRLQAVKPVIQAFVNQRPGDRIGIVVFSGRAYTLAPLTFDHDWLSRQLERLRIGLIEDGTAIGDGLGVALSRLEQAQRESDGKRLGAFLVLLTDGANNKGTLSPEQATDLAVSRGIPIYAVGAGRDGIVPMPIIDEQGRKVAYRQIVSDLDEGSLRQMAERTGGRFFRADDVHTVEAAFKAIDSAQKIDFQAKSYLVTSELFAWLAAPGLVLVLLGAGWSRLRAVASFAGGAA